MSAIRRKITPTLWFDTQAEEAANFYITLFKDSRITSIARYSEGSPRPAGTVMTVAFQLAGQDFVALNGGPEFKFNESISFLVDCADQAEVDFLWEKLSEGGQVQQCGWLRDRWGVSWQIVPTVLPELLNDPDPVKAQRVMQAMLKMVKLDVEALQRAHAGEPA